MSILEWRNGDKCLISADEFSRSNEMPEEYETLIGLTCSFVLNFYDGSLVVRSVIVTDDGVHHCILSTMLRHPMESEEYRRQVTHLSMVIDESCPIDRPDKLAKIIFDKYDMRLKGESLA